MKSSFVTRIALASLFAGYATGASIAHAQTSLGWGQHVSRYSSYGSGYVGNAPNTAPMTSYYRAPVIAGYNPPSYAMQSYATPVTANYQPSAPVTAYHQPVAPVTAYYAPAANMQGYVAPAAYAPGVSYRVGTANAAAYNTAYSPIVTPTSPYAAPWQYPPQTTMPVTANYLPTPSRYTTNYAQTPVTMYRPVTVLSPTGMPQTVLQPCTGYECQTQRKHTGFLSNLIHPNQQSTCSSGQCGAGSCASGYCGQQAPVGTPYYTPGPAIGTPLPGPVSNVPANLAPTLTSPATSPGTFITPNTSFPLVQPSEINSSGSSRSDYPPAADVYSPDRVDSFPPNVSPLPAAPLGPITPEFNGAAPADSAPSLNPPGNSAPVGSGVQTPRATPQNVNAQQPPKAVIRKESSVTPIPDSEYHSGTRAKVNKAPKLISPRDKTAQVTEPDARLARFEVESNPVLPSAPPVKKIHGDEIWRSAK